MADLNIVALVGRLTKNVEIKKTNTGKSTTTITLANSLGKDKDGNERAEFHQVEVWNQSADFLYQYAKKGTLISVNGRLHSRSYDDKSGTRHYITDVIASQVSILAQPKALENNSMATVNPSDLDITEDDLPY